MKNHENLVAGIKKRMLVRIKENIAAGRYESLKQMAVEACFDELDQGKYPQMPLLKHKMAHAESKQEFKEEHPELVEQNKANKSSY